MKKYSRNLSQNPQAPFRNTPALHQSIPPIREIREIRGQQIPTLAPRFALRKDLGFWQLTFKGRQAVFKHEQGAFYVAYLLLQPPQEPIHGLALAIKVRSIYDKSFAVPDIIQQRSLRLDEAEAVWNLRRKQHELEAILEDED